MGGIKPGPQGNTRILCACQSQHQESATEILLTLAEGGEIDPQVLGIEFNKEGKRMGPFGLHEPV